MTMKRIPTKPVRMWAVVETPSGKIYDLKRTRTIARSCVEAWGEPEDHHVEPVWVKPERRKGRKG